jgi:hypothetical protein
MHRHGSHLLRTATVAVALLGFFGQVTPALAKPESRAVASPYQTVTYGFGCIADFHYTGDAGTGSKWVTMELQFSTDGVTFTGFDTRVENGMENAQGELVPVDTQVFFRTRVIRTNGTPLSDWATADEFCPASP